MNFICIFNQTNCKNYDNLESLNTGLILDNSKELIFQSVIVILCLFKEISYLFEINMK